MRLSFNIVELLRVISRKSPILTYPPAFGASIEDDPVWVFSEIFGVRKLESLLFVWS